MTFPRNYLSNARVVVAHDMRANHPLSPNGLTHVVLDANVPLPPRLSDVLFDLCLTGMFSARWTEDIEDEFLHHWPRVAARMINDGSQLSAQLAVSETAKARKRLICYQNAVPDYKLVGYKDASVLDRVPDAVDATDKHVAAAALVLLDYVRQFDVTDKVYIVSSNVKHLAVSEMQRLGVHVLTPGKFIDSLTQVDSERVGQALNKSVMSLKSPPYTREQLLGALFLHGAKATARHFARAWDTELPKMRPSR